MVGTYRASPNRGDRGLALAVAIALHVVALFLILSARLIPSAATSEDAIRAFDVAPPPVVDTPPVPERSRITPRVAPRGMPASAPAPADVRLTDGRPAAAAPPAPDVTPTIAVPSLPAPTQVGVDVGTTGTTAGVGVASGTHGVGNGGSGSGGSGNGGAPGYLKADWIRRPTQAEWLAVWPSSAVRAKVDGKVLLSCNVRATGRAYRCRVEEETPQGHGFGRAAIRLSPVFLVRPITRAGVPVDRPVLIPLAFDRRAEGLIP